MVLVLLAELATVNNKILRKIYRGSAYLIIGYFMLVVGIYSFQDKIVFQGTKLFPDYTFNFEQPFSEITIYPRTGQEINALIFSPELEVDKGTVLYFHGNADNLQRWGEYAIDFTSKGYTVLMIDYSGFGKSTGHPSEEIIYQNAEDTWQWAVQHLPSKNFIIYGRSLGTAVASHLASKHQPQQLILESPFYQFIQDRLKVFFPFGLRSEFANFRYFPQIDCPITIIHGSNDWMVSLNSAEKLKPLLKPGDQFIVIDGGGHKNLRQFDDYHKELESVLN